MRNRGKTEVKSKKKSKRKVQKKNAKKQNKCKWVIPWEMGPHFPEKQRLGLGLGGCANQKPFPENLCAHSRTKT